MSNDIAIKFISSYRPAKDDSINEPQIIKQMGEGDGVYDTVRVYIDGSAKGSDKSLDGMSFAGWGVHYVINGRSRKEGDKFGNLFNASSYEAELRALQEAFNVVKYAANFEIVTDCADVVEGFKRRGRYLNTRPGFAGNGSEFSPELYKIHKLWRSIFDVVKSDHVKSLSVKWVRSHHYESFSESGLTEDHFDSASGKQLFRDCQGNFKSDKNAVLGSVKAVRGAINFLINCVGDSDKLNRSIETVKKNLDNSIFSRDQAIRFIAENERGYISDEILCRILSPSDIAKADRMRVLIAGGASPDVVFSSNLVHGCVISSSDPRNTNMYMRRHKNDESSPSI